MIKTKVVWRLAVTAAAGALLLVALAYWWLSNLVHEATGTLVFALVARHIYANRVWFVNLAKGTMTRAREESARAELRSTELTSRGQFFALPPPGLEPGALRLGSTPPRTADLHK
jgi:hypothetical protein